MSPHQRAVERARIARDESTAAVMFVSLIALIVGTGGWLLHVLVS